MFQDFSMMKNSETNPRARDTLFRGLALLLLAFFIITKWAGPIFNPHLSGPVSFVLANLFFVLLALRFLATTSLKRFWLAVLLFLIATRFEVLFFPVYGGDAITGPLTEAIWLTEHHFNYANLARQPGYVLGGPKVYLLSIYPSFLALQMTVLKNPKVFFFVNHLAVFALSSGITALFRELLRRHFRHDIALLVPLTLLATPLFTGQTEMINMEMPCLFFIFLSCYSAIGQRFGWAGVFAVLAALIKGTGMIACAGALGLMFLSYFFSQRHRFSLKLLILSAIILTVTLVLFYGSSQVIKPSYSVGFMKFMAGVVLNTYIFYVFLAAFAVFLTQGFIQWRRSRLSGAAFLSDRIENQDPALGFFVYGIMWIALFMNYTLLCPRYKLLIYPFLVFAVFYGLDVFIKNKLWVRNALIITIGILSLGSYGLFERNRGSFQYIELDRSLEYRNVLFRDMLLCNTIESDFSHKTILAPPVLAQILAFPEFGYVQKRLNVTAYGMAYYGHRMTIYQGLKDADIPGTVCVGFYDDFSESISRLFPFPLDARDKVLEQITCGDKKAVLFMGGFAIDKVFRLMTHLKTQN